MWWWIVGVAGLVIMAALLVWGASALWVRIISERWNAMCSDEPQEAGGGPSSSATPAAGPNRETRR